MRLGNLSPSLTTPAHHRSGGYLSPLLPPPTTPVAVGPMTCITPDALCHETRELKEHANSEMKVSQPKWRRDKKNPFSQLKKVSRLTMPSRLPSLQNEMAKMVYTDDLAPQMSSRERKKSLGHSSRGSVASEGRLSQGGTV